MGLRTRSGRPISFEDPVAVELAGFVLHSAASFTEPEPELALVACAPPEGWFDEALRLPDGSSARGALVEVRSEPVPAGAGAWRRAPVHVRCELAGHEPLEFTYTPEEGPPRVRRLRPLP